jgi:hypothetical protein
VFAGRILSGCVDRDRGPRPRASAICPIVTWLSQVSVRSCRVSVRSSFGSARSLSDRVGSLFECHLAQPGFCLIVSGLCPIIIWLSQVSVQSSFGSTRSLSDRVGSLSDHHLAQPDLYPIMSDLYPIVILLSLLLRVVCRWPDSFCDLLFGSSFVIGL